MTGGAPRGQRAHAAAPRNPGENKTVIAALALDGVRALLLATGEARQSEGRSWRRVRDAGGAEGWVVAEFVAPA